MTEIELKKHLEAAEKSPKQIAVAVSGLPDKVMRYKPAPDKWCILEILGHLTDIEIVYAYRIALYGLNRHHNLRLLRRTKPTDLAKSAYHPELKRDVTVAEMVEQMAGHGPNHLEQIERLKKQAAAA